MKLKIFLKEKYYYSLFYVNLLMSLSKKQINRKTIVLTYHRILPSRLDKKNFIQPGMFVSPTSFRRQIEYLTKNFKIISLKQLIEGLKSDSCLSNTCVITFDDGWLDNYLYAFPILKEFKAPATIFLATGFVGEKKLFWPEELTLQLKNQIRINGLFNLRNLIGILPNCKNEDTFLDSAIERLKEISPEKRNVILDKLRAIGPPLEFGRQTLNWAEVQEMHRSGLISFGGHTVNHAILDQLPLAEAEAEIVGALETIKEHLGVPAEIFAYPNGNFNGDIQKLLAKHGVKGAVTTRSGWVDNRTSPLEIPRIGIHEDVSRTIPSFWGRILRK